MNALDRRVSISRLIYFPKEDATVFLYSCFGSTGII